MLQMSCQCDRFTWKHERVDSAAQCSC